jgi:hypothetical protein
MKTEFNLLEYICKVHGNVGNDWVSFTKNDIEIIKYCSYCFHENVLMKNCEVLIEDLK